MKLLYVRHGQTDWNLQHRFQGQTDIPLNDAGRAQAEKTAQALKDEHIDVVYVSPLSRAQETAAIINRFHNAPVIVDKRITERYFGPTEGTPVCPETLERIWKYDATDLRGEESLPDLFRRVYDFLDSFKGKTGTALVAAHGAVGACVRCYADHIPPEEVNVQLILQNGEVLRLELK